MKTGTIVYLVFDDFGYDGYIHEGVFLTYKKAQEYIKKRATTPLSDLKGKGFSSLPCPIHSAKIEAWEVQ